MNRIWGISWADFEESSILIIHFSSETCIIISVPLPGLVKCYLSNASNRIQFLFYINHNYVPATVNCLISAQRNRQIEYLCTRISLMVVLSSLLFSPHHPLPFECDDGFTQLFFDDVQTSLISKQKKKKRHMERWLLLMSSSPFSFNHVCTRCRSLHQPLSSSLWNEFGVV